MGLLKSYTKNLLAALLLFIASAHKAKADGGFPVRPGRLLISPSISYFFGDKQWDTTGGPKKPLPNGGKYNSIGISIYAEYGISRKFAAVATLPYVIDNYRQNISPTSSTTSGLSDLETGIRYYLANIDFIYYFSLQGTLITPTYSNKPALGYGEEGAELKAAASGTYRLFAKMGYFNVSDGLRQYFGTNGPWQNRYSATAGLSLDNQYKNLVSITASGIFSQSNNKQFTPFIEANKDYSFFELSVAYGHAFTREISIFANAGEFLTGYNTSAGTIFSLAFIYRLDYK